MDQFVAEKGVTIPIYSDPEHKLRNYLAEQEIVKVCITGGEQSKNEFYRDLKFFKPYKHGVTQPAIIFIDNKGAVVYSIAIQPSKINWFGAKGRPEASTVWKEVQEYLAQPN